MMKKALSVALCLLMAGTVLTACSNPDEFSDSENLSLKYTRSDKTDDTFNYADGAKTAPSSYDTYSAKITDFELRLFRNRHKSGSYVFCPANAVLNLEAMANGASGDTQEEITNALCSGVIFCKPYSIGCIFGQIARKLTKLGKRFRKEQRQKLCKALQLADFK